MIIKKLSFTSLIIVMTLVMAACTKDGQPEESSQFSTEPVNKEVSMIETSKAYVHALYAEDYDRVRELTTELFTFTDLTAAGHFTDADGNPGTPIDVEREAFLANMKEGHEAYQMEVRVVVNKAFKTGKYVVLDVTFQGSGAGDIIGAPIKTYSFEQDAVTLLTFADGKVVHHEDYANFDALNRIFQQLQSEADEPAPAPNDKILVAEAYLKALYDADYDQVRNLTSEGMQFSDYTAEGQFAEADGQQAGALNHDRESFIRFMAQNSASSGMTGGPVVDKAFQSGPYVVLNVTFKGTVRGDIAGAPGKTLHFEQGAVTVITVVDGKVTRHIDYADYEGMNQQFEQQLNAG